VPQDGRTPLIAASIFGHLEAVRALLAKGADVEARDDVSIAPVPSAHLAHSRTAHSRTRRMRTATFRGIYFLSCCLLRLRFSSKPESKA
jgi:ankyrin repeat protein